MIWGKENSLSQLRIEPQPIQPQFRIIIKYYYLNVWYDESARRNCVLIREKWDSVLPCAQMYILTSTRRLYTVGEFRAKGEPYVRNPIPFPTHTYIHIFLVTLWPNAVHDLLILEVSRSHTTTHTHNRQKSMPPVGLEPTIAAGERPQNYALDRAATGTGFHIYIIISEVGQL